MRFTVIIEKAPDNFAAYVPALPGCVTTGRTMAETVANIREAIEGHIAVMRENGDPVSDETEILEVEVAV